jgi:hypothetical protein
MSIEKPSGINDAEWSDKLVSGLTCPKCMRATLAYRHLHAKRWCLNCGFVLSEEGDQRPYSYIEAMQRIETEMKTQAEKKTKSTAEEKLRAFCEGLEVKNIDMLMESASVDDMRALSVTMANMMKLLTVKYQEAVDKSNDFKKFADWMVNDYVPRIGT